MENTPGIETTHPIRSSERGGKQLGEYTWNRNNSPIKKFRNRLKTTWRIHLELKQLTQQEVQKEVENNLENTPGIETTHPIRSSERGGKQLGEYTWN